MTQWMNDHAKAIVSALVAGVFMYFTFKDNGVTSDEWTAIITMMLTTGGATWAIPNGQSWKTPTPPKTGTSVNV